MMYVKKVKCAASTRSIFFLQVQNLDYKFVLENKNKTGNIWHLVCLDTSDKYGGSDIATLKRRFDSYVGISSKEPIIIEKAVAL